MISLQRHLTILYESYSLERLDQLAKYLKLLGPPALILPNTLY